jgi:CSLREA domain-containing protein
VLLWGVLAAISGQHVSAAQPLVLSVNRISQRNSVSAVSAQASIPSALQVQTTGDVTKIDPAVWTTLDTLRADEQITVIVTLREQASVASAGAHDQNSLIQQREFAADSQARLEPLLESRRSQGTVSRVIPFWIFNGFSVTATPAVIRELSNQPDVLTIAPDAVELSLAQGGGVEANLAGVNAPALWGLGWQGQGVVVADLDTGVDLSHSELASRWRGGANSWFDPYGQRASPVDFNGHGTWTMGVMVGGAAGGSAIGVAPQARWIAARIFNDRGESTATAIHLAFQWLLDPDGNPATDDAPQVVNNSWTLTSPGCNLAFELDLQALRAAGILPIFAAGNSGPASATSRSPANNPSAFAVGAIADNDQLYAGSGRGPSSCNGAPAIYPALMAPGVAIRTTDRGGGYVDNSTGTSLAAPHVAGGVALLLSAFPDLIIARQEAALLSSAFDLGAAGPDNEYGAGRLDLLGAYQWLLASGVAPQTGAPIVVNTASDVLAEDGVCSLREAVLSANTDTAVGGCVAGGGGDTILFDSALARPVTITLAVAGADEDAAATGDLDITGTLSIDGMATGAAAAALAPTIVIDGRALDRVFDIQPGAHVTIQGVAIRNGLAAIADAGGGVRSRGELTLRHASVSANQGGGLRNAAGSMMLSDVVVNDNLGGYGIVNVEQGVLTIADSKVNANQGGGLYNQVARATLNRVEVTGNSGSALVNTGSTASNLTVTASTVMSNNVTGSGGGLLNNGVGATTTLDTTRMAYNTATAAGGAIFNSGILAISASLIDHNQANTGGGIDHASGALTIANSTISQNRAGDNGGGLSNRVTATARFVTFNANSAAGAGGNIFNDEGSLALSGAIIANAPEGDNCANSAGFINSDGYNVESADTCGLRGAGDLVNTDPFLGPLQDNSGPTLTHALRIDSLAIDRAPATTIGCGAQYARDQRGIIRPLGNGCDAGAYEATSGLGDITPIYTIQGASHTSLLAGATVTTRGIVTVLSGNGFYMQSAAPDSNPATSEGIFVTTGVSPTATVGDDVLVLGQVAEVKPTNRADELTTTRLINPTVTRISTNHALPPAMGIGRAGRVPPSQIIEDDALAVFDPATDGLDFYESLEGMRVQIDNALVVGATDAGGALWVVADEGLDAGPRSARGGVLAQPDDANPEVIRLDARLYPAGAHWPVVDAGAVFTTPVVGVMDAFDARYRVQVTAPLIVDRTGQVSQETTTLTHDSLYLTVGELNVAALSGADAQTVFSTEAALVVERLGSPDLLVLEEVGDDNGSLDDGVAAANVTFSRLITAVQSAGGPTYSFTQIDPLDAEDGGALGSNVRLGFLYNPARLELAARPGDAGAENSVLCSSGQATLAFNPGRIGVNAPSFMDGRKPLAAQFSFSGETLFVIAVYFDNKGMDSPRYGAIQPPLLNSAARRLAQAQVVHAFVQQLLACEPDAKVIVTGNPQDDLFAPALNVLQGTILTSLMNLLPSNAAYSEVDEGVSRVAGQSLVSDALWHNRPGFDVVHVRAEFAGAVTQDPTVARISLLEIGNTLYLPLAIR